MKTYSVFITEANAAALEKKIVRKADTIRNHMDRGIRGPAGHNVQAQKNVDAIDAMIKQYKDEFGDAAWKAFAKKQGWVADAKGWDFYA